MPRLKLIHVCKRDLRPLAAILLTVWDQQAPVYHKDFNNMCQLNMQIYLLCFLKINSPGQVIVVFQVFPGKPISVLPKLNNYCHVEFHMEFRSIFSR